MKNEKLRSYLENDPTKETKQLSIRQLCEEIESGSLILPIFQTSLRWTEHKAVDLFNYQLMGKAPVAPISINLIDNPNIKFTQHVTFLHRESIEKQSIFNKMSVTDGQQRLSTNYKAYTNHADFSNIVLDLKSENFKLISGEIKNYQIPVGVLYNKDFSTLEDYVKKNKYMGSMPIFSLLDRIRNKFLGYYYTINYARNMNEEEQMEWFDVLNLAGSTVTAVMVNLSELLAKGVDFYKNFADPFLVILAKYHFADLLQKKSTEVSIPLASLNANIELISGRQKSTNFSPIPSDVKPEILATLSTSQIEEIFSNTLKNLENACNFLISIEFTPTRIDYLTYLLSAFSYMNTPQPKQLETLKSWVIKVDFNNKSNSERRKIYSDLIDSIAQV